MTREVAKYIVYAIEEYKRNKKMDGKDVANIFKTNNIYDFIEQHYQSLHTGSSENLVLDIDQYMKK